MAIIKFIGAASIGPNGFSQRIETKQVENWSSFCKDNHKTFASTAFTKRNRRRLN